MSLDASKLELWQSLDNLLGVPDVSVERGLSHGRFLGAPIYS